MWFAENLLQIDIKMNVPIEIFENNFILIYPRKIIMFNEKKNQIMFSDDFVIIFILATITNNCEKYTFPFANQT